MRSVPSSPELSQLLRDLQSLAATDGVAYATITPSPPAPNPDGPAFGLRKVALYATCVVDYNHPDTAVAAAKVLALQGCEVELVYPECCRMLTGWAWNGEFCCPCAILSALT